MTFLCGLRLLSGSSFLLFCISTISRLILNGQLHLRLVDKESSSNNSEEAMTGDYAAVKKWPRRKRSYWESWLDLALFPAAHTSRFCLCGNWQGLLTLLLSFLPRRLIKTIEQDTDKRQREKELRVTLTLDLPPLVSSYSGLRFFSYIYILFTLSNSFEKEQ